MIWMAWVLGSTKILMNCLGQTPPPVDRQALNRRLIHEYESVMQQNREAGVADFARYGSSARAAVSVPPAVTAAASEVTSAGIAWILTQSQLYGQTDPAEISVQEFFRSRANGMPWLPRSYRGSDSSDIEENLPVMRQQLSARLEREVPNTLAEQTGFRRLWIRALRWLPLEADRGRIFVLRDLAICLVMGSESCADGREHAPLPDFLLLRTEIHQAPTRLTLLRVEQYIEAHARGIDELLRSRFNALLDALRVVVTGRGALEAICEGLPAPCPLTPQLMAIDLSQHFTESDRAALIHALKELSVLARRIAEPAVFRVNPLGNLIKLEKIQSVAGVLSTQIVATLRGHTALRPAEGGEWLQALIGLAWSMGYLEPQLSPAFEALQRARTPRALGVTGARALSILRAGGLRSSLARVVADYRVLLQRYRTFAPSVADAFLAEELRTSMLTTLDQAVAAIPPAVFELLVQRVLVGDSLLNGTAQSLSAGGASGRLVYWDDAHPVALNGRSIVVYPRTPAELPRVAGVITCNPSGQTSHVQLLALANGMPHAFMDCEDAEIHAALRRLEGQDVFFAVSRAAGADGYIFMQALAALTPPQAEIVARFERARTLESGRRFHLQVPSRLSVHTLVPLETLSLQDRGHLAGGKACGLGVLSRVFRGRGSPGTYSPDGVVLPFGVFAHHMNSTGLWPYIQSELRRIAPADTSPVERIAVLAEIRRRIENVALDPRLVQSIQTLLSRSDWIGRGVFVRSDTNAEDLPNFSGAGLNGTLGNVPVPQREGVISIRSAALEPVLRAVLSVWASPFTERSFSWRSGLVDNPWDVYPSVVIQKAMPSTRSGVMIVGALDSPEPLREVLISGSFGLGITVVDNLATPEETLIRRNGAEMTVERMREAVQNVYVDMDIVNGGTPTRLIAGSPYEGREVFTESEALALARMGIEVQTYLAQTMPPVARWDLEFGWWEDHPILLQVRPFIGSGRFRDLSMLNGLLPLRSAQTVSAHD